MGKVFIEESTLTAIGDAIRVREGSSDKIAPLDMPMAIIELPGGSDPVIEALSIQANGTYTAPSGVDGYSPITVAVPQDGAPTAAELTFSGDCSYLFNGGRWDWVLNKHANLVSMTNITNMSYCFRGTQINKIPFTIQGAGSTVNFTYTFYGADKLTEFPDLRGCSMKELGYTFQNCKNIREVPESFVENNDWVYMDTATGQYNTNHSNIFNACFSLRRITPSLFNHYTRNTAYSGTYFNGGFRNCTALDELTNLPCYEDSTWTSNSFTNTFDNCNRLKNIIFATNEDGSAKVSKWKNQTITLTINVGAGAAGNATAYNTGITADKEVKDDATYQALKNDNDWFTADIGYSRYNHDSAVATINSLPDTSAYLASAGGTNTIKFAGSSGLYTDGGAINTLTAEEIAVAAAKGWTVTFV